jgi:hypothetical protein
LTDFISDALRQSLAAQPSVRTQGIYRIPTFRGTGLQPGVNLDDTADLLDRMERDG